MKNAGEPSKPPQELPRKGRTIEEVMLEGTEIDEALRRAVREALIRHKKLGNPVAVDRRPHVPLVWREAQAPTRRSPS
jgi:hypothetical protein